MRSWIVPCVTDHKPHHHHPCKNESAIISIYILLLLIPAPHTITITLERAPPQQPKAMKNIASIVVSIGMAGSFAATAYIVPSPGLPSSSRPQPRAAPSRRSGTSRIFFRDADDPSFDVVASSGVVEPTPMEDAEDFQGRMRSIVAQRTRQRRETHRPANVKNVISLEEFATVIDEGRRTGSLVVVRFHATWCKVRED